MFSQLYAHFFSNFYNFSFNFIGENRMNLSFHPRSSNHFLTVCKKFPFFFSKRSRPGCVISGKLEVDASEGDRDREGPTAQDRREGHGHRVGEGQPRGGAVQAEATRRDSEAERVSLTTNGTYTVVLLKASLLSPPQRTPSEAEAAGG